MSKQLWKPGTMVYPVPVVLVSCGTSLHSCNIITIAWTGTICTEPAKTYISLRPERHSYKIIKETGEFVINLTTQQLAFATDFCGVKSGRDIDKWKAIKLTPIAATHIKAPLIQQSPINIECKVSQIIPLGSHDMFIADVVAVHAESDYMDKHAAFHFEKINSICYAHGKYYAIGKQLGHFGFSVKKH